MNKYYRGDIVYVDLGQHPNSSVQSGKRPCVIMSNNKSNRFSTILNVYPLTTRLKNNPVHVKVEPEDVEGFFEKTSELLAEQPVTIDKKHVIAKIGSISKDSDAMKRIESALLFQFGMMSVPREEV